MATQNERFCALVVDCIDHSRSLPRYALNRLGGITHEADSAECAIDRINANPSLDVVFFSWNLPASNALELVYLIRSSVALRSVSVILIGPGTDESSIAKAQAAGANQSVSLSTAGDEIERELFRTGVGSQLRAL